MTNYCENAFDGLMDHVHRSQNAASEGLSMDRFFSRFLRMLEKKSRLFWNKWYFIKYTEDNISPWGLRIQIFPTITQLEPELKLEWEENLQTCSMKMMEFLCKHYTNELTLVDKGTEILYEDNQLITTDVLFPARENVLKTNLEIYVAEILKTKEKKFVRDKLSYDNKQAYNWAQTNNKGRRRINQTRPPRQLTSEPNDSDSSVSSISSSQAQDFTRITKIQGSMNPKHFKEIALTGTVRRTPSTKAPMVTRAGAARTSSTNAPGQPESIANTCLTNIVPTPVSNTQVNNANPIPSQSDFRPAPIFSQPVLE